MVTLISDKTDFRTKKNSRNEEGLNIMIMGSIHQDEITILYIYASNNRDSKHIKQKLTKLQE